METGKRERQTSYLPYLQQHKRYYHSLDQMYLLSDHLDRIQGDPLENQITALPYNSYSLRSQFCRYFLDLGLDKEKPVYINHQVQEYHF